MPTKSDKSPIRTFTVTYSNGEEIKVKRVPASKLEDVADLCEGLFSRFFTFYTYSKKCLGDVLGDRACWGYIEKLAAMLPVVGVSDPGINLSLLEEDYEQIGHIFLTQSIDLETGEIVEPEEGKPLRPSLLAELYGQHFFRVRAVEATQNQEKQEQEMKLPKS